MYIFVFIFQFHLMDFQSHKAAKIQGKFLSIFSTDYIQPKEVFNPRYVTDGHGGHLQFYSENNVRVYKRMQLDTYWPSFLK